MNRLIPLGLILAAGLLTGFRNPPGTPERFIEMGEMARIDRNYDEALVNFSKAISLVPDRTEYYFTRAFLLLKMSRFDEAIRDFTAIIALDPENPRHYFTRGMAYDQAGQQEQAGNDFAEACRRGDVNGCSFGQPAGRKEGK